MKMFSIMTDKAQEEREKYLLKLDSMSDREIIKEFLSYLDYTEESDSGKVFHPIDMGCCRVSMIEPFGMVLKELRTRV